MIETKQHADENWKTTEYRYQGYLIVIKSRAGSGMKAHVFDKSHKKVLFTFRYYFVSPSYLLQRCKDKIDILKAHPGGKEGV